MIIKSLEYNMFYFRLGTKFKKKIFFLSGPASASVYSILIVYMSVCPSLSLSLRIDCFAPIDSLSLLNCYILFQGRFGWPGFHGGASPVRAYQALVKKSSSFSNWKNLDPDPDLKFWHLLGSTKVTLRL